MSARRAIRSSFLVVVAGASVALSLGASGGVAMASTLNASVTVSAPSASAYNPRLTKLAAEARKLTTMHIPYSLGGHGASPAPVGSSVDCSGLVRSLYKYAFGVDIGGGNGDSMVRTSGEFVKTSHPVPGDVVLVGHGGVGPAYHAMVYVGNDDGHPTSVGSPDFGSYIEYQHPWTRYWANDVMGYWHYRGATAQDSAPLVRPKPVAQNLSGFSASGGRLTISGWAFDPADPGRSTTVTIFVSGHKPVTITADAPQVNVNKYYHVPGNHGFSIRMIASPGHYTVRSAAHAVAGTGSIAVYSRTMAADMTLPTSGHLNSVTSTPGRITVTGWAYDRIDHSSSNRIQISVNDKVLVSPAANLSSASVDRALHITGNHAFAFRFLEQTGHTYKVCVTSMRVNHFSISQSLGCKSIRA